MQQYSGWVPKEFDEAGLDTGAVATDPSASGAAQQQPGARQAGSEQQQPSRPAPEPSTFVYDPNTGAPCQVSVLTSHWNLHTYCNVARPLYQAWS